MMDLIGDIHGHAAELEALLLKLGYQKKGGELCTSRAKSIVRWRLHRPRAKD